MSDIRKWHRVVVDKVMQRFGDEIEPTAAHAAVGVGQLPPSMFEAFGNVEGAPKKFIDGICQKVTWPSFSPLSKHLVPGAVSVLLDAHENDNWHY